MKTFNKIMKGFWKTKKELEEYAREQAKVAEQKDAQLVVIQQQRDIADEESWRGTQMAAKLAEMFDLKEVFDRKEVGDQDDSHQ